MLYNPRTYGVVWQCDDVGVLVDFGHDFLCNGRSRVNVVGGEESCVVILAVECEPPYLYRM